jgi:hypothetical protein
MMNNDEIFALVKRVELMDEDCQLILSNRQLDWLWDLVEHVDAGRFQKVSENAIKFLQSCESGFYSASSENYH